jgi:hypothetical protein
MRMWRTSDPAGRIRLAWHHLIQRVFLLLGPPIVLPPRRHACQPHLFISPLSLRLIPALAARALMDGCSNE